jgi:flagellar basal body-associated protein FliL
MDTLLLFLIVLLSVVICALAGFWFYRASQERKKNARPPQIGRRAARQDRWDGAVRASRDEV